MLFNKHGRQDNGHREQERSGFDALMILKMPAFRDGEMGAQRIINMDAGPEIGRGIRFVQAGNQLRKNIVPGHYMGTQMMSVGPDGGYDQKNGHACKKKNAGPVIFRFIFKKEECHYRGHIGEPQKIWYHEDLHERNIVIQRHVYDGILPGNRFFQMAEPCQINDAISN